MPNSLRPLAPVPSAIAPHLLHSPVDSPTVVDLHTYLDAYHDNQADSPHSLSYPQASTPDASKYHPPEPQPPVPDSVTSPSGMLVVHSYAPASAPPGAALTAHVDFMNYSGTNVRLRVVFGDLALPTSVSPNGPIQEREPGYERGDWKLRIAVPPVGQASAHMAEIGPDGRLEWPLTLQALDSAGNLLDTIGFGLFAYETISVSPRIPSPPTIYEYKPRYRSPNKRSRGDDDDYSPSPSKRPAVDTEFCPIAVDASFADSHPSPTAHRPFLDTSPSLPPSHSSSLPSSLHAAVSISQQSFKQHIQPPSQPESPVQVQVQTPPAPPVPAVPSSPGAHSDDGPALVRTSQLGQDANPEQASVSVQGDLETMKRGWTEGECGTGRRLVQFWKRQIGTTLHISFAAISQNDYKENTIVVSCIYRDNVDDYFITSVDVIYLLEALAGNTFQVDEKNRIRRNLEGFRPMTISKSKAGTEEFFRVIMELPTPRPRNIEKDVKVFEWGRLRLMLEKVFSKYSTVPLAQHLSSPRYHRPVNGTSSTLYSFPRASRDGSLEHPRLSVPLVSSRHKLQKKHSSLPSARLRDVPSLPPLHISLQNQGVSPTYSEHFLPTRYNDYEDELSPGRYSYAGLRLFDYPPELDQGHLKADMGLANRHVSASVSAPTKTGGRHDGFGSGSPLSCNNSPSSMSLSVSSGTSSEGGHVENQDLVATPVIHGASSEPMHISHPLL